MLVRSNSGAVLASGSAGLLLVNGNVLGAGLVQVTVSIMPGYVPYLGLTEIVGVKVGSTTYSAGRTSRRWMFLILPPVLLRRRILIRPRLPTGCPVLRPVRKRETCRPLLLTSALSVAESVPAEAPLDVNEIPPSAGPSDSQPHWMFDTVLFRLATQDVLILPTR